MAVGEDRAAFHVWDLSGASADPLWSVGNGWLARHAAFTPDSNWLVYVDYDGLIRCAARTGALDKPRLTRVPSARFVPGGRIVISSAADYPASVLSFTGLRPGPSDWIEAWRVERRFNPNHDYLGFRELLFSSDGARFARVHSLSHSRKNVSRTGAEVFNTATGELVSEWAGTLPTYAREGALGPSETAALLHQRALYAINTAVPKSAPVKRLNSTLKHFTSVAFSPNGTRLATTSNDTAATIWDTTAWEPRKRYEWNIGRLRAVCFAPDGLRCAAAGDAGQVVVWDLDD